jgi:farnesyl-diphosphate farnesyltransferase
MTVDGPGKARSDGLSQRDRDYLLNDLLRDVSRSFFLTLKLLPGPVRQQIGLAYLLARATDTIADTGAISIGARLEALTRLRTAIMEGSTLRFDVREIRMHQSSDGEQVLLERIGDTLSMLSATDPEDRKLIQRVLEVITSGQELDLRRFANVPAGSVAALSTAEELDDYTYRVAGCVGEFWTRICVRHLAPSPGITLDALIEKGIRFGKGLQLVNILRDLPADLRLGRCYLPQDQLRAAHILPEELLNPANQERVWPIYKDYLSKAHDHLEVAWSYVLDLPRSWLRVRLACALPVLIGVKTLNKLQHGNVLNPDTRIKVSRKDVRRIVRLSILLYPLNSAWRNLPMRVARA